MIFKHLFYYNILGLVKLKMETNIPSSKKSPIGTGYWTEEVQQAWLKPQSFGKQAVIKR